MRIFSRPHMYPSGPEYPEMEMRVWNETWPGDVFEIITRAEHDRLFTLLKRFGIFCKELSMEEEPSDFPIPPLAGRVKRKPGRPRKTLSLPLSKPLSK